MSLAELPAQSSSFFNLYLLYLLSGIVFGELMNIFEFRVEWILDDVVGKESLEFTSV